MPLPMISAVARVGGEPELRFTNTGKAVCSLRLVFSKRRQNPQTNEWEDAGTLWVNATAWDQLGENIAESGIAKGAEVLVHGELSQREYEKRDGGTGTSLDLNLFAIGPDLRRVTAKVQKVERSSSRNTGNWQPNAAPAGVADDPWATAADEPVPF